MTQQSSRLTLKQRFSPHPPSVPRTTWQRFNRAKTDSGWPLLAANLAVFSLLAAYSLNAAVSGSLFFSIVSVSLVLGVLRTGHVMLCVAQGKVGTTATGETVPADATVVPDQRPRLF